MEFKEFSDAELSLLRDTPNLSSVLRVCFMSEALLPFLELINFTITSNKGVISSIDEVRQETRHALFKQIIQKRYPLSKSDPDLKISHKDFAISLLEMSSRWSDNYHMDEMLSLMLILDTNQNGYITFKDFENFISDVTCCVDVNSATIDATNKELITLYEQRMTSLQQSALVKDLSAVGRSKTETHQLRDKLLLLSAGCGHFQIAPLDLLYNLPYSESDTDRGLVKNAEIEFLIKLSDKVIQLQTLYKAGGHALDGAESSAKTETTDSVATAGGKKKKKKKKKKSSKDLNTLGSEDNNTDGTATSNFETNTNTTNNNTDNNTTATDATGTAANSSELPPIEVNSNHSNTNNDVQHSYSNNADRSQACNSPTVATKSKSLFSSGALSISKLVAKAKSSVSRSVDTVVSAVGASHGDTNNNSNNNNNNNSNNNSSNNNSEEPGVAQHAASESVTDETNNSSIGQVHRNEENPHLDTQLVVEESNTGSKSTDRCHSEGVECNTDAHLTVDNSSISNDNVEMPEVLATFSEQSKNNNISNNGGNSISRSSSTESLAVDDNHDSRSNTTNSSGSHHKQSHDSNAFDDRIVDNNNNSTAEALISSNSRNANRDNRSKDDLVSCNDNVMGSSINNNNNGTINNDNNSNSSSFKNDNNITAPVVDSGLPYSEASISSNFNIHDNHKNSTAMQPHSSFDLQRNDALVDDLPRNCDQKEPKKSADLEGDQKSGSEEVVGNIDTAVASSCQNDKIAIRTVAADNKIDAISSTKSDKEEEEKATHSVANNLSDLGANTNETINNDAATECQVVEKLNSSHVLAASSNESNLILPDTPQSHDLNSPDAKNNSYSVNSNNNTNNNNTDNADGAAAIATSLTSNQDNNNCTTLEAPSDFNSTDSKQTAPKSKANGRQPQPSKLVPPSNAFAGIIDKDKDSSHRPPNKATRRQSTPTVIKQTAKSLAAAAVTTEKTAGSTELTWQSIHSPSRLRSSASALYSPSRKSDPDHPSNSRDTPQKVQNKTPESVSKAQTFSKRDSSPSIMRDTTDKRLTSPKPSTPAHIKSQPTSSRSLLNGGNFNRTQSTVKPSPLRIPRSQNNSYSPNKCPTNNVSIPQENVTKGHYSPEKSALLKSLAAFEEKSRQIAQSLSNSENDVEESFKLFQQLQDLENELTSVRKQASKPTRATPSTAVKKDHDSNGIASEMKRTPPARLPIASTPQQSIRPLLADISAISTDDNGNTLSLFNSFTGSSNKLNRMQSYNLNSPSIDLSSVVNVIEVDRAEDVDLVNRNAHLLSKPKKLNIFKSPMRRQAHGNRNVYDEARAAWVPLDRAKAPNFARSASASRGKPAGRCAATHTRSQSNGRLSTKAGDANRGANIKQSHGQQSKTNNGVYGGGAYGWGRCSSTDHRDRFQTHEDLLFARKVYPIFFNPPPHPPNPSSNNR